MSSKKYVSQFQNIIRSGEPEGGNGIRTNSNTGSGAPSMSLSTIFLSWSNPIYQTTYKSSPRCNFYSLRWKNKSWYWSRMHSWKESCLDFNMVAIEVHHGKVYKCALISLFLGMFAWHVYPELGFFFGLFKINYLISNVIPGVCQPTWIPSNSWFNYGERILTSASTGVKNQQICRFLKRRRQRKRRGLGLDLTAGAGQVSRWDVGLMGQNVCHAKRSCNWRYRSRWTPFWEAH